MKPKTSDQLPKGTHRFYSRNFNLPVGNDSSWIEKIDLRRATLLFFVLIFIFLPPLDVTGQTAEALFDTVRFEENGRTGFDYKVSNSNIKTIGHFYVVIDPQFVPELDQWNKEILKMEIPGESAFLKGRRPFALWGDLWGQEILLIYNLGNNSMYLFNEMDLRGIFQPEQRKLLVSRKKIQKPLLLIKNTLDEQIKSDVLLFSMIGQWFMVSSHDPR